MELRCAASSSPDRIRTALVLGSGHRVGIGWLPSAVAASQFHRPSRRQKGAIRVELLEVTNEQISDPVIRDRDATSSRCAFTRHFLAIESGSEVGLLSIDIFPDFPDEERFVIYELFVPTAQRRRGVGTRLLEAAEEMGRVLGYKSALLVPKTLDKTFPQRALKKWYARKGYLPLKGAANGAVVKQLAR